jgi:hypothetical protein
LSHPERSTSLSLATNRSPPALLTMMSTVPNADAAAAMLPTSVTSAGATVAR